MSISPTEFKDAVLEQLLDLLWRQWNAVGVPGYSRSEESNVVDPEPLLMLTLTVARHDARLFDEVLDWLDANGEFLNVQRLHNHAKDYDYQAKAQLSAVAKILGAKSSYALKWSKLASEYSLKEPTPLFFMKDGRPMPVPADTDITFRDHGFLRPVYTNKGLPRPFPGEGMPALLLRLRALFGVNIRCEILCMLGSVDEIHPSLIARLIGQAPRTTQNLLAGMVRSGAVQVRTRAREKFYSLSQDTLDNLLKPEGRTPWVNSVPLFRALEILWLGLSDPKRLNLDKLMLASEWRRLARDMRPLLGDAGMGQLLRDDSLFKGEKYYEVFMEDIKRTVAKL
jgi:hypothetical protein